jgi:predicted Zn-dependent protease
MSNRINRDEPVPRYPNQDYCVAIANKIIGFATRKGAVEGTSIRVAGDSYGSLRWARNQVSTGGEQTNRNIFITSVAGGKMGLSVTNEASDPALKATVLDAETISGQMDESDVWESRAGMGAGGGEELGLLGPQEYLKPNIFFDNVIGFDTDARSKAGQEQVKSAVDATFMSYGFMANAMAATGVVNTNKLVAYQSETNAEFSCTVRSKNMGSGWAGASNQDLSKVNIAGIMRTAIDKCNKSQNPTMFEPGRHVAILEPQALADMFGWVFFPLWWDREAAERGTGPFGASPGKSKIGAQMMDRRLTIYSDPVDSLVSYRPFSNSGTPLKKTMWFENGVLKNLPYNRDYAVKNKLNGGHELPMPPYPAAVYNMTGGDTSMEEMIKTTRRGFLITRFNGVLPVDWGKSLQLGGNTRDGLWYIENGEIKSPAKNFRFTESPLFILNGVEQLGPPQRVFSPGGPAALPAVKVRDFSFTALADAV